MAQNYRLARLLIVASSVVKTGFWFPSRSGGEWLIESLLLSIQTSNTKEKLMFIKTLRAAGWSLAVIALLTAQPLCAQSSSDTARIEKLERAVELLENRTQNCKRK